MEQTLNNIIAPTRILVDKEKWYKSRKGAAICLVIFVLGFTIVGGYLDMKDRMEMEIKISKIITIPHQQIINETYCEVDYSTFNENGNDCPLYTLNGVTYTPICV
jgi:hypothetical protein